MKKLILLALVVILLPTAGQAYNLRDGDPGFIFEFVGTGSTVEVIMGETWCDFLYCANYYWLYQDTNGVCFSERDTFAVVNTDLQGWDIECLFSYAVNPEWLGNDADGYCVVFDDTCDTTCDPYWVSWLMGVDVCITVPCDQGDLTGQLNTLTTKLVYCDDTMTPQPDTTDCVDPNWRNPYDWAGETEITAVYSTTTMDFEVVESPPPLTIFQDTLYFVEEGVTTAYIPFSICNGNLCAGIADFDYIITSLGVVGPALNQTGTVTEVGPGECGDVYGIMDASTSLACQYDTLTIIAWNGPNYDTCVQAIHVVEPVPVPLFTAPVVTILVLAMILAAAVIMKRHAVSKV
jgi:hypothetical protein